MHPRYSNSFNNQNEHILKVEQKQKAFYHSPYPYLDSMLVRQKKNVNKLMKRTTKQRITRFKPVLSKKKMNP